VLLLLVCPLLSGVLLLLPLLLGVGAAMTVTAGTLLPPLTRLCAAAPAMPTPPYKLLAWRARGLLLSAVCTAMHVRRSTAQRSAVREAGWHEGWGEWTSPQTYESMLL
jgi:hypothetical protein